MVDTVNILALWALLPEIAAPLLTDGFYETRDWYITIAKRPDRQTDTTVWKLSGSHRRYKIVIRGKGSTIEWIQVSLPHLLHGYNGRVIKNPQELTAALELLFQCLAEISIPIERLIEFIRVDLVLNLPGDPKRFVQIHKNARHPYVRNEDIQYGDSGIRFPGKERTLQLYWKQKERADKSGFDLPPLANSIRIELQLKGKYAVREVLGGGDVELPITALDFYHCYRCYRYALCLFDKDILIPDDEKCSLMALIAECEAQDFKTSWGASALEWYASSGQKPATVNRNRAIMQARKQKLMAFKWADILPPLTLPDPVIDIYPDGQEFPVHSLLQVARSFSGEAATAAEAWAGSDEAVRSERPPSAQTSAPEVRPTPGGLTTERTAST